jgi:hypothetical protein
MRLPRVLTVGLLTVFVPSLWSQYAVIDSWVNVSPSDGTWEAGGDTFYSGEYGCELCSTNASVSVDVYADGYYLTTVSYSDPNGNASTEYVSDTIVNLGFPL